MSATIKHEDNWTIIELENGYDITISPEKTATIWKGMERAKSVPPIVITYNYAPGDTNQYEALRSGKDAIEFVSNSWLHGRTILDARWNE